MTLWRFKREPDFPPAATINNIDDHVVVPLSQLLEQSLHRPGAQDARWKPSSGAMLILEQVEAVGLERNHRLFADPLLASEHRAPRLAPRSKHPDQAGIPQVCIDQDHAAAAPRNGPCQVESKRRLAVTSAR